MLELRHILVAAIAASVSLPALAIAAPAPAPAPAAQGPKPVTRAMIQKSRDDAFKKIDANGDGNVTAAELANAEAGAVRARLQLEFNRLDTNHDGQLSQTEFLAQAPTAAALTNQATREVAALDKNKDGKVTIDEFRAPQLAMFDRLDANHDGTVTPEELKAAQAARKK